MIIILIEFTVSTQMTFLDTDNEFFFDISLSFSAFFLVTFIITEKKKKQLALNLLIYQPLLLSPPSLLLLLFFILPIFAYSWIW